MAGISDLITMERYVLDPWIGHPAQGIPIDNRNYPVAVYAGSTVGRTLAVDRHSLNNVDYVRIQISNMNVALVPPVVSNVNIGASFYDLEFTREIPRGRPQTKAIPVPEQACY
jgi:hypothetical protein